MSSASSDWHKHEKGIFAGCCVSIILFIMGMNIFIEYICNVNVTKFINSAGTTVPPVRAFMDDLNFLTALPGDMQVLLNRAATAMAWARMSFRAKKCRSLALSDGKMTLERFTVVQDHSQVIPSVQESPVKFLGRLISEFLSDAPEVDKLEESIVSSLGTLDRCDLRGQDKVWVLNCLLLCQIRWVSTIYEISLSSMQRLEKTLSKFTRKWLGVHKSLTGIALYSKQTPCPLPFKSLTSIFKASKFSGYLQLRDSKDPVVAESKIKLAAGSLDVQNTVSEGESIIHFKKILGHTQAGTAGLGYTSTVKFPQKGTPEYRRMVSDVLFEEDDKVEVTSSLDKKLQMHWVKWCNYVKTNISWTTFLSMPANLLRFQIGSTFNTLPSPSNLSVWKLSSDPSCALCGQSPCTIPHVLSGCPFSLNNGRWSFRHDSVLVALLDHLQKLIDETRYCLPPSKLIAFVASGSNAKKKPKRHWGLIHKASDWTIMCDVGQENMIFPFEVAYTSQRPDIVVTSKKTKTIILIENTSGCEENAPVAHQRKIDRYEDLCKEIRSNGWACYFFAIEVNARGFCSTTVSSCMKSLGFTPSASRKICKALGETAMKCSFVIWTARDNKLWVPEKITWKGPDRLCQSEKFVSPVPTKVQDLPGPDAKPKQKSSRASQQTVTSSTLNPVGLINKGQTCYANTILQLLFFNPQLLTPLTRIQSPSPLIKSLILFKTLSKMKPCLDPKFFLSPMASLICKTSKSVFKPNKQHDVPEVLTYILNELASASTDFGDLCFHSLCSTVSCNTCCESSSRTEVNCILPLPITISVASSLQEFFADEPLSGVTAFDCLVCGELREATKSLFFQKTPQTIFVQLLRFVPLDDKVVKKTNRVHCNSKITIPCCSADGSRKFVTYQLTSVISHTGSYEHGHYFFQGKDPTTGKVILCDDTKITEKKFFEDQYAYLLVYRKV